MSPYMVVNLRRIIIPICLGLVHFAWATSHLGAVDSSTPDSYHYATTARGIAEGHGLMLNVALFYGDITPIGTPVRSGPERDFSRMPDAEQGYAHDVWRVPEYHGLLRPYLLATFFWFFDPSMRVGTLLGLFFLAATAALSYALASRLAGPIAGLAAWSGTALSPKLGRLALLSTDDIGFACFATATVVALLHASESDRPAGYAMAGACAGMALLEKFVGVYLGGLLLLMPFMSRPLGVWRASVQRAAAGLTPMLACFGLYLARNVAASGQLGFRVGPLDWYYKRDGLDGVFAIHDPMPGLGEVLTELGASEVLRLCGEQFARLFRFLPDLYGAPGVVPLALLATLLLLGPSISRRFAITSGLSLLGSAFMICCVYHFEPRYIAMWIPLLVTALAVAARQAIAWSAPRLHRAAQGLAAPTTVSPLRFEQAMAIACAGICAIWLLAPVVTSTTRQLRFRTGVTDTTCARTVATLAEKAGPHDRVLTFRGARLTWKQRLSSLQIPAGGTQAIARVARHYEAQWLLPYAIWRTRPRTQRVLQQFIAAGGAHGVRVTHVTGEDSCALYALSTGKKARAPR